MPDLGFDGVVGEISERYAFMIPEDSFLGDGTTFVKVGGLFGGNVMPSSYACQKK